ncbi:hypothetical protein [Aeromicrobium piscarium]|uniref:Uncharacterized protein n=1 Tax=Aeromicrobium piscarium TaxID=2590901 RepID=A0A554SP27_9ACTN|nr:hypothetical protein [Aeromicrobium piscarium]TSD68111.1 hypothetical protein FNM00_00505 [Aeromicrobium piscarium]
MISIDIEKLRQIAEEPIYGGIGREQLTALLGEVAYLRRVLGLRTEALNRVVAQLDELRGVVERLMFLIEREDHEAWKAEILEPGRDSRLTSDARKVLAALLPDTPTTDERSTT